MVQSSHFTNEQAEALRESDLLVDRARGGTSCLRIQCPKVLFTRQHPNTSNPHLPSICFFRIFSIFHFFSFLVLLVFVGSRLAKSRAALQLKQQGFFFQTQEMVIHLYHGGGASYQVSARGYFANTLILIPSAYTIQLQVSTTVIVICLLWTISESPYWGANISSCTSVAFPTCFALCF